MIKKIKRFLTTSTTDSSSSGSVVSTIGIGDIGDTTTGTTATSRSPSTTTKKTEATTSTMTTGNSTTVDANMTVSGKTKRSVSATSSADEIFSLSSSSFVEDDDTTTKVTEEPFTLLCEIVGGKNIGGNHNSNHNNNNNNNIEMKEDYDDDDQNNNYERTSNFSHTTAIENDNDSSTKPQQQQLNTNTTSTAILNHDLALYCTVEWIPPINQDNTTDKTKSIFIHQTQVSQQTGQNPIWSISTGSFFLLTLHPTEMIHIMMLQQQQQQQQKSSQQVVSTSTTKNDNFGGILVMKVWYRDEYDPTVTTMGIKGEKICIGSATYPVRTILCKESYSQYEHRMNVPIYKCNPIPLSPPPTASSSSSSSSLIQGYLSCRFRIASPSDIDFIYKLYPNQYSQTTTMSSALALPTSSLFSNDNNNNSSSNRTTTNFLVNTSNLLPDYSTVSSRILQLIDPTIVVPPSPPPSLSTELLQSNDGTNNMTASSATTKPITSTDLLHLRNTHRSSRLFQVAPSVPSTAAMAMFGNHTNKYVNHMKRKTLLITEGNESDQVGESIFQTLTSVFTSKTKITTKNNNTIDSTSSSNSSSPTTTKRNRANDSYDPNDRICSGTTTTTTKKILVKPYPDPNRIYETSYLTKRQLLADTMLPSYQYIEVGSGNSIGHIYVEILGCNHLPNVDVGESLGNYTDCFITVVHEDGIAQTDVILDELNPKWLPWTQRAFRFNMISPSSYLFLGAFDMDYTSCDPLGRVAINIRNFQPQTEYTVKYPLIHNNNYNPSSSTTKGNNTDHDHENEDGESHDDQHSNSQQSTTTTTTTTDVVPTPTITVRIRVVYHDEGYVLYRSILGQSFFLPSSSSSLSSPIPNETVFHVNVMKPRTLAVVRYTCYGSTTGCCTYEERSFDVSITKGYVNEIFEYKQAISYAISDSLISIFFWRGQVTIFSSSSSSIKKGKNSSRSRSKSRNRMVPSSQLQTETKLPIHSMYCFIICTTLIERPYLFIPFLCITMGYILWALQLHRHEHPSVWSKGCPPFTYYVQTLLRYGYYQYLHHQHNNNNNKNKLESTTSVSPKLLNKASSSTPTNTTTGGGVEVPTAPVYYPPQFKGIKSGSNEKAALRYEKERYQRYLLDQEMASHQTLFQQRIQNEIGSTDIHTQNNPNDIIPGFITSPELYQRLGRYQNLLGQLCHKLRLLKLIVTWEDSLTSFRYTLLLLSLGCISLLLPWQFLMKWGCRILVWGGLGPHMKLVDYYLYGSGSLSTTSLDSSSKKNRTTAGRIKTIRMNPMVQKLIHQFHSLADVARLKRQDALQVQDVKYRTFGSYSSIVPMNNVMSTPYFDKPLPESFAKYVPILPPSEQNQNIIKKQEQPLKKKTNSTLFPATPNVRLAPYKLPGQQVTTGTMLPRTEWEQIQYEQERNSKFVKEKEQYLQKIRQVLLKKENEDQTTINATSTSAALSVPQGKQQEVKNTTTVVHAAAPPTNFSIPPPPSLLHEYDMYQMGEDESIGREVILYDASDESDDLPTTITTTATAMISEDGAAHQTKTSYNDDTDNSPLHHHLMTSAPPTSNGTIPDETQQSLLLDIGSTLATNLKSSQLALQSGSMNTSTGNKNKNSKKRRQIIKREQQRLRGLLNPKSNSDKQSELQRRTKKLLLPIIMEKNSSKSHETTTSYEEEMDDEDDDDYNDDDESVSEYESYSRDEDDDSECGKNSNDQNVSSSGSSCSSSSSSSSCSDSSAGTESRRRQLSLPLSSTTSTCSHGNDDNPEVICTPILLDQKKVFTLQLDDDRTLSIVDAKKSQRQFLVTTSSSTTTPKTTANAATTGPSTTPTSSSTITITHNNTDKNNRNSSPTIKRKSTYYNSNNTKSPTTIKTEMDPLEYNSMNMMKSSGIVKKTSPIIYHYNNNNQNPDDNDDERFLSPMIENDNNNPNNDHDDEERDVNIHEDENDTDGVEIVLYWSNSSKSSTEENGEEEGGDFNDNKTHTTTSTTKDIQDQKDSMVYSIGDKNDENNFVDQKKHIGITNNNDCGADDVYTDGAFPSNTSSVILGVKEDEQIKIIPDVEEKDKNITTVATTDDVAVAFDVPGGMNDTVLYFTPVA